MEERALSREYLRHVSTKRFGDDQNQQEENEDLSHAGNCHLCLEALRFQQCVDQVEEQEDGSHARNDVIHEL